MLSDRYSDSSICTRASAPSRVAGTTTVSLHGEIDLANSMDVVEELCRYLVGPSRSICVDLGGVTFMDCRGIDGCLEVQRRARLAGYDVRFANPQGIVARLILMLDLEAVLLGSDRR